MQSVMYYSRIMMSCAALLGFVPLMGDAADDSDAWYRTATIYHVWLKSFAASKPGAVGSFDGLIEKLDYLNDGDPATTTDLGVNTLLLSPFYKAARMSAEPTDNMHGYDLTDYYQLNPYLGDRAALKRLLDAAHARGMQVLFDFVPGYTSVEHPWFQDAKENGPLRDWYIWSEQPDPAWGAAWGGGQWHDVWKPAGDSYFYSYFQSAEIADLNLTNPEVIDTLNYVLKYWLQFGFDGARIDGAPYLVEEGPGKAADTEGTLQRIREFRQTARGVGEDKLLVGELWRPEYQLARYFEGAPGMQMGFDFDGAKAIAKTVLGRDVEAYNAHVQNRQLLPESALLSQFLSNHDSFLPRPQTQYKGNANMSRNAAVLQWLGQGVPIVYYGNEIGMTAEAQPDAALRMPFVWQTVELQNADPDSLLSWYRYLSHLRAHYPVFVSGAQQPLQTTADLATGFYRQLGEQVALVAINSSYAEQTVTFEAEQIDHRDAKICPLLGAPNSRWQPELKQWTVQLPAYGTSVVMLGTCQPPVRYLTSHEVKAPQALVRTALALPSLYLRGSMNGWGGNLSMQKDSDGIWQIETDLPAGRHEYKFEVNGQQQWGLNWGDSEGDGIGDVDGRNLRLWVPEARCYRFRFDPETLAYQTLPCQSAPGEPVDAD